MTQTEPTPRLTMRMSRGSLAFARADQSLPEQLRFEPYVARSGVSLAVNLREAFKSANLLQQHGHRAQVLVDSPTLLVPIEEFADSNAETLYMHSFPRTEGAMVMSNVLPDLHAVALFAMNKDFKMVVEDHFSDVRYIALMRPVWNYMLKRGMSSQRRKLYAYFHDGALEIFSFERNRFLFANRFVAKTHKDALYFILFVWKQLVMDQQRDELYLAGNVPQHAELVEQLKVYLKRVATINPSADFNRAPMTAIKGITLDLLTLYIG